MQLALNTLSRAVLGALFIILVSTTGALAQIAPGGYDYGQLHAEVRRAAENGRENYYRAQMAAARARFSGAGTLGFVGDGGDRYDGEGHSQYMRNGYGVNSWNDGEHHGGQYVVSSDGRSDLRVGYGVYVFADGSRYEGQFEANAFSGYGVMWSPTGAVQRAGIWRDNQLATPLSP
jgi:hypothetical protein